MIDEGQARLIAQSQLGTGATITQVRELPDGWVYYWTAGDERHLIVGNVPVFVDREEGSLVWTGPGPLVEESIGRWRRQRAWRRAASLRNVLVSDTLEELAALGPQMKVPVGDRLRERHPSVDAAALGEAVSSATGIGELALALTEGEGHPNDFESTMQAAQKEFMRGPTGDSDPGAPVVDQLATQYPELYRPALVAIVSRARYWWLWEI